MFYKTILFLVFCFLTTTAVAKKKHQLYPPDVILVQIKSEQRKIEVLEERGGEERATQIKKDAIAVRNAMMNDFNNNFKLCPVYYFLDTNLDKVLKGDLDNVLMDSSWSPVAKSPLKTSDTSFYIAFYGVPVSKEGFGSLNTLTDQALILFDHNRKQIDYFWKNTITSSTNDNYNYESKISRTVSYTALASTLQSFMVRKLRKHLSNKDRP